MIKVASLIVATTLALTLRLVSSLDAFPVCLVQSPGFVACNRGQQAWTYSGYDVDTYRYLANSLGWIETVEALRNSSIFQTKPGYYFVCTNLTAAEAIQLMASNSTACGIAIGRSVVAWM